MLRQFLIVSLAIVIGLSLITITYSADKWTYKASQMATNNRDWGVCRDRVIRLGKQMQAEGVKFYVAIGWYRVDGWHCWIVHDSEILDPTQIASDKSLYKEVIQETYERFVEKYK